MPKTPKQDPDSDMDGRVVLELRTSKIRDQSRRRIPRRTIVVAAADFAADLIEKRWAVTAPPGADLSSARTLD